MGDIFDSVIVGFLAVLGIDAAKEGFQEATTYTSHLSALIKIAQSYSGQWLPQKMERPNIQQK